MKLIPFAAFPPHERDALQAMLQRVCLQPRHVCVSRLQPLAAEDEALPSVALVSAPGFSRAYEGEDWIARLERDLRQLRPAPAPAAPPAGCGSAEGSAGSEPLRPRPPARAAGSC